ncbi:alpha/beta hydrolase fold domain-containing protein [Neorhodopirellula lusitana]|uniref:alpha/beta hydrolase fold domain-containing protein n=1 Tax=Neorhodopirellula lusitana TaxID=445327 RepID=UPI00384D981E
MSLNLIPPPLRSLFRLDSEPQGRSGRCLAAKKLPAGKRTVEEREAGNVSIGNLAAVLFAGVFGVIGCGDALAVEPALKPKAGLGVVVEAGAGNVMERQPVEVRRFMDIRFAGLLDEVKPPGLDESGTDESSEQGESGKRGESSERAVSKPLDDVLWPMADLYVPIVNSASIVRESGDVDGVDSGGVHRGRSTVPIEVALPRRPAILLVHGGAWVTGDKWLLRSYADDLSRLGCVVLNINYRLAPGAKFPAQVDDVREGLIYLRQHADALAIDVDRIGAFGYSAGGHLSALVGLLADEPLEKQTEVSEWRASDSRWTRLPKVAAVCVGGPPCDFREIPLDNTALTYFLGATRRQTPEVYESASPIVHISPNDPPTHLFQGETDLLVPLRGTRRFATALKEAGVAADLTVIEGQGHMLTFRHPESRQVVLDFFAEQLLP